MFAGVACASQKDALNEPITDCASQEDILNEPLTDHVSPVDIPDEPLTDFDSMKRVITRYTTFDCDHFDPNHLQPKYALKEGLTAAQFDKLIDAMHWIGRIALDNADPQAGTLFVTLSYVKPFSDLNYSAILPSIKWAISESTTCDCNAITEEKYSLRPLNPARMYRFTEALYWLGYRCYYLNDSEAINLSNAIINIEPFSILDQLMDLDFVKTVISGWTTCDCENFDANEYSFRKDLKADLFGLFYDALYRLECMASKDKNPEAIALFDNIKNKKPFSCPQYLGEW